MTESPGTSIRFFFDYVSPYAYLAWTRLPGLMRSHDVSVEPVPVLLAGLLKAHGSIGPAETPAKKRWMVENVLQTAKQLDVPIRPPAFHPFNPLLALRVTAGLECEPRRLAVIDACFQAVWRDALHISDARILAEVLDELGIDSAAALKRAKTPAVKELLRQQTDDAIALGVFGVPTFILDGQLFWGVDEMARIEARLRGDDLLDEDASRYWLEHVQSSAERKRP